MDEDQSAVHRRQAVVDDDVYPFAVLPDVEVEDAGVVLDEQVVLGNDVREQVRVACGAQRRRRRQEPTVTYTARIQSVRLSVCLSVYICMYVCTYLSIHPSIHPSIYLSDLSLSLRFNSHCQRSYIKRAR